ncbi:TetR/AcrR family transcriptional regulator [Paraconexibacter sp. AEG42_29]|uniref:TetR/AcrR family transcriptional regulator n=1 Tax=Paraconexibacter sp. AEG42_29 TaxID=2997339 RepID=UPI00339D6DAC
MSHDSTGTAPADRTLALLWADAEGAPDAAATTAPAPRRRGPQPRQSVPAIVDAAITLADADGLADLTMRRLAVSVGVAPMTLYTYIPGKAELLDLMLDTVYRRMERPPWSAGAGWRERLALVAAANRTLLAAHPWAIGLGTTRPPLGPGVMAKYEHELAALDDAGLDDVARDAALTFLLGFVTAAARAAVDAAAAVAGSGVDDATWWAANGPLLARVLDAERYPLAVRVGAAAGAAQGSAADPAAGYAFGLERVLDGLQALIERSPAG